MDDFLAFVVERHRIWEKRQAGLPGPWTTDPILASRKFTNVFRVLDPGTQFVLNELLDPGLSDRDQLMRLFLYRHTGRIETWEWLHLSLGRYPLVEDLTSGAVMAAWSEYRGKGVWKKSPPRKKTGRGGGFGYTTYERLMFTNAYLVFPQSSERGTDKLGSIVDLSQRLFTPSSPNDVLPDWRAAKTQAERFNVLKRNKGVGDFMSMQVLADWGYQLDEDREDEFLVPGPGSIKGAKALDGSAQPIDLVKRVVRVVREMPDCPRLGYRVPSLMDIGSNLLCEWSKYVRYREQPTQPKPYEPAHPGLQPEPTLPSYYTEGADLL